MNLLTGAQIGPYEVVDLLGAGAMGEVYRARDTRLHRNVAVKVLPARVSEDPDRLRRFEQEARAAGALNHPNILAIHDVGANGGSRFIVSELLDGQTLRGRMADGPVPPRKVVEYAVQIARGLAAAHEKGIVHRDLKPENVFLTRDGAVKILDFGLAKLGPSPRVLVAGDDDPTGSLTQPGTVLGTVGYMSPEQVRGDDVDPRSDIFSFGAILYEMLAGRKAFKGKSAVETMNAILKEDPPPLAEINPSLPPGLERIVTHCLEKRPEERFQSARDMAFDLEALSHSSSSGARALARDGSSCRRRTRVALAIAVLVGLPAAGFLARGPGVAMPLYHRVTYHRGIVGSARFAPDGQVLYSAAWDGKPAEVYAAQPESPESRPLGLREAQVVSVIRPGELGLILTGDDGRSVLARVPLAGGPPREVAEDVVSGDATPDGSSFAVLRKSKGRVRLEMPPGRILHEAIGLSHARLSPGADRVAVLEHPVPGDDRGFVAVVDGAGHSARLSSEYSSIQGLAWSPLRDEVWFTGAKVGAESSLYAVSLSGRERLVARAPGRLVIHDIGADGRVLMQRMEPRMEMRALLAGEAAERDLSWFDHSAPVAFSRDARRLLFYESGEAGGPDYSVYLRGTDGSPPVRLGEGRAMDLSPDGKWALSIPLSPPDRLVLLPTGAGEARTIRQQGLGAYHMASFFPDGRRLLVEASEEGHAPRLYEQDLDNGRTRPIAPEGVTVGRETLISPDGRLVVGYSSDRPSLYPTAGGEPRPIPGLAAGESPVGWTPDGLSLLVRAGGGGASRVFRLELQSGRRTPWKEVAPADPAGVSRMSFVLPTPDGTGYVYNYVRVLSSLYVVEGLR